MKKKSLALAAIAVLMVASLATAVTLAYFTDTKSKTNTFIVGNVEITLAEPSWDVGKAGSMKANPGVAVPKDPYVTNTGANDAYVRLKVTVDDAAAFKAAAAKYGITNLATIFDGHNGTNGTATGAWVLASTDDKTGADQANTLTYVYNYNETLATDETTKYLFTSVTLPSQFNNADVEALAGIFNITVVAEAIQADGFDDSAAAFTALDTQLAATPAT